MSSEEDCESQSFGMFIRLGTRGDWEWLKTQGSFVEPNVGKKQGSWDESERVLICGVHAIWVQKLSQMSSTRSANIRLDQ